MLFRLLLGFALLAATTTYADMRTWTDYKGRSIEAKMIRVDGGSIRVRRADGKELTLKKKNLSDGDIAYLNKLAAGGGRGGEILDFDSFNVDKKTFKEWKKPFTFGELQFENVVETPHFLVIADGDVRRSLPLFYGEVAERLLLSMAQDDPGLLEYYAERRMPILLVETAMDRQLYQHLTEYYQELRYYNTLSSIRLKWETLTIKNVRFGRKDAETFGLAQSGRVFNAGKIPLSVQRRLRAYDRIHFIASTIMSNYLDDVDAKDGKSLGLFRLGYEYLKEDQICGRVETEVVYGGSDLTVGGFEDGRTWPNSIKKLIDNPNVEPSLNSVITTKVASAQPAEVGFAYGLAHFVTQDAGRRGQYAKLLASARELEEVPAAKDFAEAFGFTSVAEFDKTWIAYMKSDAFE